MPLQVDACSLWDAAGSSTEMRRRDCDCAGGVWPGWCASHQSPRPAFGSVPRKHHTHCTLSLTQLLPSNVPPDGVITDLSSTGNWLRPSLQNAMTSSEARTSTEAEGYRIERSLMDCVAPLRNPSVSSSRFLVAKGVCLDFRPARAQATPTGG